MREVMKIIQCEQGAVGKARDTDGITRVINGPAMLHAAERRAAVDNALTIWGMV